MDVWAGAQACTEKNGFISSRAVAKVGFEPVDETFAVLYISRFDSPLEAVGIAVSTGRERRRQPALQSQERGRRAIRFLTHDDAHRRHGCHVDRYHRTRPLR